MDAQILHKNLTVCRQCLMAIEAHEGKQLHISKDVEDENEQCDWCGGTDNSTLYEII